MTEDKTQKKICSPLMADMHGSSSSGVHSDALHCVVRQRIGLR